MGIPDFFLAWIAGATTLFALLFVLSRLWAHRFPRVFQVLWLVFFVKLMVPVGLWSPVPMAGGGQAVPTGELAGAPVPGPGTLVSDPQDPVPAGFDPVPVLAAVWVLGTLVVWGTSLGRRGEGGPAAVGILRPRVVLPRAFGEAFTPLEQDLIVAHEGSHLRARDPLWLALVQGISGMVWWFVPVWWARREFLAVTELACDARVLAGRDPSQVRTYGELLIRLASGRPALGASVGFAGRFSTLKRRMANLSGRPNRSLVALGLALLAAGGVVALSLVPMAPVPVQPVATRSPVSAPVLPPFVSPLPEGQGWIALGFGTAKHPFTQEDFFHKGTDWAAREGTPVRAIAAGTVVLVGYEALGYGVYLDIDHGSGVVSRYAHLKQGRTQVKEGDRVEAGQVIAQVGNTGLTTGPHLHWEVQIEGEPRDPLGFTYR